MSETGSAYITCQKCKTKYLNYEAHWCGGSDSSSTHTIKPCSCEAYRKALAKIKWIADVGMERDKQSCESLNRISGVIEALSSPPGESK